MTEEYKGPKKEAVSPEYEVRTGLTPKGRKGRGSQELSKLFQETAAKAEAEGKKVLKFIFENGTVQTYTFYKKRGGVYVVLLAGDSTDEPMFPPTIPPALQEDASRSTDNTFEAKMKFEYSDEALEQGGLAVSLAGSCLAAERRGKRFLRVNFKNGTWTFSFKRKYENDTALPPHYVLTMVERNPN